MSALGEIRALASYLASLRRFLREPVSEEAAIRRITRRLPAREDAFLDIVRRGVFDHAPSPYRALFRAAGIEYGDLERMVRQDGLEPALERLYDDGVRITNDELRGRVPISRDGLELAVKAEDFDNPLAPGNFEVQTGGSRSGGAPITGNLGMIEYEAGYYALLYPTFGLHGMPVAMWFTPPPNSTGLSILLRQAKFGVPVERWFSQTPLGWKAYPKHALLTKATLAAGRLWGSALAAPEYTPPEQSATVARWLAATKDAGAVAQLATTPGLAVRVCLAARELGLDISGTFFRLGGEPYTRARAAAITEAGCRAASNYFISELGGHVGLACGDPNEFDEVHVLTDKVAAVRRETRIAPSETVDTLAFTTLHPLCPKLLINLESDDYGALYSRDCGCALAREGFSLHLHGIRSYDKLTSEGVTFMGSDVITLVEEFLPRRFGGSATDYQLVEYVEARVPGVALVVRPNVGDIDDGEVVKAAIAFLRTRGKWNAAAADIWRESGTVRVVRRAPYVTGAAKIPIVHVIHEESPWESEGEQ